MGIIKANKYLPEEKRKFGTAYADESDVIPWVKGHVIQFFHMPSGHSVSFKAFLTQFSDEYGQKWSEDEAYGRMDDIQKYQGTKRTISIAWEMPAHSVSEALRNAQAISKMAAFQYPGYEDHGYLATTISTPPLFKVKMMNLVKTAQGSHLGTAQVSGLLCKMDGWKPEWSVDVGAFDPEPGIVLPKLWRCSVSLTILHTHSLGWKGNSLRQGGKGFPYGIETFSEVPVSAADARTPEEIRDAMIRLSDDFSRYIGGEE